MNFSIICRTKQNINYFQIARIQYSNILTNKFSTKVNSIRLFKNHGLFTQKKTSSYNNRSSNFDKINLYQSFTINKLCRNITTTQNNDTGEVEASSSTLPQDGITENVDSAANFTNIIEPITSNDIAETALKIGDLKAMGLVNFTPVGLIEECFEILHVSTGLPWWGTITLATLILRIGLFPLLIKSQLNVAKLTKIQPKSQKLMEEIKRARVEGDQQTVMAKSVELKQLYLDNNISVLSPLLPLIQMPIFVSFFFALRKMAELPVPGFEQDGILWFKDLSVPDPQSILPFLVSGSFILLLESNIESSGTPKSSQTTGIKWLFRVLGVTSIFFTMHLPSAILYHFVCANSISFVQSQALKNKKVRKYFGLPAIPRIKKIKVKNVNQLINEFKEIKRDEQ
ncbi:mitochondrial inner membrane protein OXA1L [Rhizophagus clarus]|uniref:Mitochondrial inner membrane protein OXA1L n=1 Tax=Rhizophagus clarus TaxID=94130 RepID=A0A8H3L1K0_9GLOM|nr:mitochondrial inner membrane protein OXA1L [Rhizophagus clarus]